MTYLNQPGLAQKTSPASLSVLAIDDDEIVLDIVQELLMQLGIRQVQTAGDGYAGLRALCSMARAPDFVIVDVFMPDMDGIEFLKELAKTDYQGGVILASGSDVRLLQTAQKLAIANGLNICAALVKPLHREDLAQALALR